MTLGDAGKRFSDFSREKSVLDGNKVRIDDVLNVELRIVGYRIKSSKFEKNKSGNFLTLQIELCGERRVVFTGSDVLIGQIEKYKDEIPFLATIKKVDRYYTLS